MAIDPRSETLFPLNQVPSRLEKLSGHKVHVSALYRWIASDLLDCVRIGGRVYCSDESLDRLIARSNKRPSKECHPRIVAANLDYSGSRSAHELAEQSLDEEGI
jgi:hypothetical protein